MQLRPHISLYSSTGMYVRSIRAQEAKIMLLEGVAVKFNSGGKVRAIQMLASTGRPTGKASSRPDQSYTWREPVRGADGDVNGYVHQHKWWKFRKEYKNLYKQVQLDCLTNG